MESSVSEDRIAMQRGFTLIEITISIAIISILAATSLAVGGRAIASDVVRSNRDQLYSALNTTRTLANSGRNDTDWSLRVTNSELVVFSGSNFLARDTSRDVVYPINPAAPITPLSLTTTFTKQSPSSSAITFTITHTTTGYQDTVSTNTFGAINR
jgi:prepilin-type N-terminal cleavage/methylation domain-containing protein